MSRSNVIEISDSSEESDCNELSKRRQRSLVSARTPASDINGATTTTAKKVHNRRKSLHHSIRALEDMSFESMITGSSKADNSSGTKKRWSESIEKVVMEDKNNEDPEMTQMLKKIAYCRVFTNYLLRQYDMLAIDFKLYSNIDLLMMELKKRVDTYTAIRRSRQRLLLDREIIGNI